MRIYALMALLSVAMVSGCNTANSVSSSLKVTTASKPLKMDLYYSINPDCSSIGQAVVRIIEPPKHGKVELKETTDFPYFRESNSRSQCNTRRVPATQVIYVPSPGYQGQDSFKTDVVFASGTARTYDYKVEVR